MIFVFGTKVCFAGKTLTLFLLCVWPVMRSSADTLPFERPSLIDKLMETKHYPCEDCKLRARYDRNPRSLIGRFWHWHIGFCPGWKAFYASRSDEEKEALRLRYNLKK